jgi:hypothetical protein
MGDSPAWGQGEKLTNPHRKKKLVTKCYTGPPTWRDSLERPIQWKMDMKFDTQNVWSLYKECSQKTTASKSRKCKLDQVAKGRHYSEALGEDGRILECVLGKQGGKV